jgi:hypothetical protein
MLRTIAGILIGYLVFAVPSFLLFRLAHVDPHLPASLTVKVIAIIYGVVFALLGGYLGTAIGQKFWIAFTIAAILTAGAVSSMIATGINWSPLAALVGMAPATMVGGWLHMRRN